MAKTSSFNTGKEKVKDLGVVAENSAKSPKVAVNLVARLKEFGAKLG